MILSATKFNSCDKYSNILLFEYLHHKFNTKAKPSGPDHKPLFPYLQPNLGSFFVLHL